MIKKALVCIFFVTAFCAYSQEAYKLPQEVKIVEKHNYSHYVDGRYIGHIYRELRGKLVKKGNSYQGTAFFLEALTHLAPSVPRRVDEALSISYVPDANAALGSVFPTYKAIPFLPAEGISQEKPWRGFGYVGADPLGTGDAVNIKVYVEYKYAGKEVYNGEDVFVINAQFALRYKNDSDSVLLRSEGKHLLTIYVSEFGSPVFIKDSFNDEFVMASGQKVNNKGFVLVWFYDVVPFDYDSVFPLIVKSLDDDTKIVSSNKQDSKNSSTDDAASKKDDRPTAHKDDKNDKVTEYFADINKQDSVEKTEEGIKITIRSLRFVANKAELLPGEEKKLVKLAESLKKIPGRTILITGHTADIGRPTAQKNLSIERAKHIVDELVKLGVEGSRLIYQGKGGTEPVADNKTEQGRALNRRVEITILED